MTQEHAENQIPRHTIAWIQATMEGVVLAMLLLAPWCFGSVQPIALFGLFVGLALVAMLFSLRMIIEGRMLWQSCPLAVCLGLVLLTGVAQIVPLPTSTLEAISPHTATMYSRLLPERPEQLPFGQTLDVVHPPPGSTISLYPHATRSSLAKLLAALLLYICVRNGFASAGSLQRLCIVACANGMLLSLFALVQYFTSNPGEIFWTIAIPTEPFGPFVCRNHFPFYINICIALGFGLLCSVTGWQTLQFNDMPARSSRQRAVGAFAQRQAPSRRRRRRDFEQPGSSLAKLLWIALCLSLMVGAVVLSMSRGGLLTLLAAGLLSAVVLLARSRQILVWAAVGIVALAGAGLVVWMGSEKLERRIDTIWSGQAIENRLPLWLRSIELVRTYPLWGTGLGTFETVEPLTRTRASDVGVLYDHAHNEYVEAVVEGGLFRLAVMLAGIVLVLRMGWRAANHVNASTSGLALGALLAVVTVAIHSVGEFGIHMPAITILVIAVAAHVSALAAAAGTSAASIQESGSEPQPATSRLALGTAALALAGLPMVLCWQAWWSHVAIAHFAVVAEADIDSPEVIKKSEIELLQTAVNAAPTDALLQHELGERRMALFQQSLLRMAEHEPETADASMDETAGGELIVEQLVPALRHFVQARNLSPLMPEPQFALAANADRFARAEPPEKYLRRVQLLARSDPHIWYLIGQQQLLDGLLDKAWLSWRRSLELADEHLADIVNQASEHLTVEQLRDEILPPDPWLLLSAARHPTFTAVPAGDQQLSAPAARTILLSAAVASLEASDRAGWDAERFWLAGQLYGELERHEDSIHAFRDAVQQQPAQLEWRLGLAKALYNADRLEEAHHETRLILSRNPRHAEARNLLHLIGRRKSTSES